jgi:predicted RNase H-like HicB family nuclease
MSHWTIRAEYDPEARVWYAAGGDIPGLAADADTLEELAAKAGAMLPELLRINAEELADVGRIAGPHRIRIVAFHEREFDVAA